MGFDANLDTKRYSGDQLQYLIMNYQPQETWIVSEPLQQELIQQINATLNGTEEGLPLAISGIFHYQFTRSQPVQAVTPEGEQHFQFFDQADPKKTTFATL
jgi:hypothetical protein